MLDYYENTKWGKKLLSLKQLQSNQCQLASGSLLRHFMLVFPFNLSPVCTYLFKFSVLYIMNIVTTVNGFWFLFFRFGNVKLKRTLIIIIPSLSVASRLCVAVSLRIVRFLSAFFFLDFFLDFFFFLVSVHFWYALQETVNNCIIHWTKEGGTHYVYLKLVSW